MFGQTYKTYRNRSESTEVPESTAIVQKVQIVRDVPVKRIIRRSLRVCTGFSVIEVVRGVRCGLIKVAVT